MGDITTRLGYKRLVFKNDWLMIGFTKLVGQIRTGNDPHTGSRSNPKKKNDWFK